MSTSCTSNQLFLPPAWMHFLSVLPQGSPILPNLSISSRCTISDSWCSSKKSPVRAANTLHQQHSCPKIGAIWACAQYITFVSQAAGEMPVCQWPLASAACRCPYKASGNLNDQNYSVQSGPLHDTGGVQVGAEGVCSLPGLLVGGQPL